MQRHSFTCHLRVIHVNDGESSFIHTHTLRCVNENERRE